MSLKELMIKGGEVVWRKAEWKWQKDGEKILTRGGEIGMVASGLYAVKKTHDIQDLLKETKADIQRAKENGDKKAIRKASANRYIQVGKHYILPTAGALISMKMIEGGLGKSIEKTSAMAATATLYAATLRNYRKNVIAEYGKDVDRKFMTTQRVAGRITESPEKKEEKAKTNDEEGSVTLPVNPNALRIMYSREMTPDVWHDSHVLRIATLDAITNELDVALISNGHLSLNDQRRKFGGPKMDVGIGGVIGRIWDPGNPKNPRGGRRVKLHYEDDIDFMEGRKNWCWIIFDVDDEPIVDRMDEKFTEVEMP